jgi:hypothetical protein
VTRHSHHTPNCCCFGGKLQEQRTHAVGPLQTPLKCAAHESAHNTAACEFSSARKILQEASELLGNRHNCNAPAQGYMLWYVLGCSVLVRQ